MKRTSMLAELRNTPEKEMESRLARVEKELAQMNMKRALKRLANPMQIREHRKEIARIKMLLAGKQFKA